MLRRLLVAVRQFAERGKDLVLGRHDDLVVIRDRTGVVRRGHVAAWGRGGMSYRGGDPAPHMADLSTYSLQTREGWFVTVVRGKIMGWCETPAATIVIDVHGRRRRRR